MNNLILRTLTGIIFVLVVVFSILWSKYSFLLLFAVVLVLGLIEFHQLVNGKNNVQTMTLTGVFGGIIFFTLSYLNASGIIAHHFFAIYVAYFVIVLFAELFRKSKNPIHNLSYFSFAQAYIAFPFSVLNYIYFFDTEIGAILLLAMFLSLWMNDTGAYVVGSMIGKNKFFERISPKKTWEGFFGGILFTAVLAYILSIYISQLTFVEWLMFTEIASLFGTFGDLLESMIKRTVNVKDSGKLIPGHGGLLDRFDSMLLLSPVIWMYLMLIL